jgi:eukaryotic-like serine/threonine-protein kinase
MPFCSNCGQSTGIGDPFCGECGVLQKTAPAQAQQASTPPRPMATTPAPGGVQHLPSGVLLADRYQVMQRVGGGGMGSVYKAADRNLAGRVVAVKEMMELFSDPNTRGKAIEDFKRESELLAGLEHPSIPTIYDYFFDSLRGRYYLVMRFIDGGDLADYQIANGGRIDELIVTQWAIQICEVLDYIHSQNPPLIYRDLKPANLMLDTRTQKVMLVDFGIARFVSPAQKGVTAVGTMGYAPPELFSGKVVTGSDLYSLGATMFHLLTGKDPQENPLLIFDFTKNPKPRDIHPAISEGMEKIICRAVEHDSQQRFPSARDFRAELLIHLKTLPTSHQTVVMPAVTPQNENRAESVQEVPPPPATCTQCGQTFSLGDVFCIACGADLKSGRRITAKLIIEGTNEIAAQFPLDAEGEHLIGRPDPGTGIIPAVDLSRFDPQGISRRHAKLVARGGQFLIEDLGSINGTFINNKIKLSSQERHLLSSGDSVRIGSASMKFVVS